MAKELAKRVDAVRAFNRFYTQVLGVLDEKLLKTPFSLAEGRVLYELAHAQGDLTAAKLAKKLGIDPAYLSRMLAAFKKKGYVTTRPGETDKRAKGLSLTAAGRKAYAPLNDASQQDVTALLSKLPEDKQGALVAAMQAIQSILAPTDQTREPYIIRPHRPGDVGWIVHRHGVLYWDEHKLDGTFEGLVAEICGQFLKTFDPMKEHCWVAERDGAIAGSVFCVRQSDAIAKLRLLYVEPHARGLGIGRELVKQCISFARQAGYKRLILWTQNILTSARPIYEAAGFRLVDEEKARQFGRYIVGQNWELKL